MLYKKIHRQYIREYWIGRRFRFFREVFKVTSKPRISKYNISIEVVCSTFPVDRMWELVRLAGLLKGTTRVKDKVKWLED